MVTADVIADETALVFYQGRAISKSPRRFGNRRSLFRRGAEKDFDRAQVVHRGLSIDIELAQGFDFIAKEFDPHRQRRLPRIKIDNSAADSELSARGYLSDAFITGVGKLLEDAFHFFRRAVSKLDESGEERARFGRGLIEAGASCNNDVRSGIALDERKQGEALGRDLRVGQDIFDRDKICFRQEERVRLPGKQTLVEQFLGMNARAEDPNRLVDVARDGGNEE